MNKFLEYILVRFSLYVCVWLCGSTDAMKEWDAIFFLLGVILRGRQGWNWFLVERFLLFNCFI